jgi:hypothetical protein
MAIQKYHHTVIRLGLIVTLVVVALRAKMALSHQLFGWR